MRTQEEGRRGGRGRRGEEEMGEEREEEREEGDGRGEEGGDGRGEGGGEGRGGGRRGERRGEERGSSIQNNESLYYHNKRYLTLLNTPPPHTL